MHKSPALASSSSPSPPTITKEVALSVHGVIQRLDDGPSNDRGSYQCVIDGCGWKGNDVSRNAPKRHVAVHHPHVPYSLERLKPSRQKRGRPKEEDGVRQTLGLLLPSAFLMRICAWYFGCGLIDRLRLRPFRRFLGLRKVS